MEPEKDFQTQANEAGERFVESARVLLETLKAAEQNEDEEVREDTTQEIEEYPLSVQVRSGKPAEYEILLSTGGQASRIIGTLSEHCEPESASFEFQDWFKPWTAAQLSGAKRDLLLDFASHFYFGG